MRFLTCIAVIALFAVPALSAGASQPAPEERTLPERFGHYVLGHLDPLEWYRASQAGEAVHLAVGNEEWIFFLGPNPVRAPDAIQLVRLPDGSYTEVPLPASTVFSASEVWGSASAVFHIEPHAVWGRVLSDGLVLYIQPLSDYDKTALPGRFVAYQPEWLITPAGVDASAKIDNISHEPEEIAPPDILPLSHYVEDEVVVVADTKFLAAWGSSYVNRIDYLTSLAQDAYVDAQVVFLNKVYGQDNGCTFTYLAAEQVFEKFKECWPKVVEWGYDEANLFHKDDMSGCYAGWGGQRYAVIQTAPDYCHFHTVPNTDHEEAVIKAHESGHVHSATHEAAFEYSDGSWTVMGESLWDHHHMGFSAVDTTHNNRETVRNFAQYWNY